MTTIIDTADPNYIAYKKVFYPMGGGMHNGAYYYSQDIVKNIIDELEQVTTDEDSKNWVWEF